jgi:hypothetical protein
VAGALGRLGVEVRIPRLPEREVVAATEQVEQDGERKWKIVPKHGFIQVEPIIQKEEKEKEE